MSVKVEHSRQTLKSAVYGTLVVVHKWRAADTDGSAGAAVGMFHGYGAHAFFPTIRHAAEVETDVVKFPRSWVESVVIYRKWWFGVVGC
jgi:hypothetical protein